MIWFFAFVLLICIFGWRGLLVCGATAAVVLGLFLRADYVAQQQNAAANLIAQQEWAITCKQPKTAFDKFMCKE